MKGRVCNGCSYLETVKKTDGTVVYYCNDHDCRIWDIYTTDNPCNWND